MKLIFLYSGTEILLKKKNTQKTWETGVSAPVFAPDSGYQRLNIM